MAELDALQGTAELTCSDCYALPCRTCQGAIRSAGCGSFIDRARRRRPAGYSSPRPPLASGRVSTGWRTCDQAPPIRWPTHQHCQCPCAIHHVCTDLSAAMLGPRHSIGRADFGRSRHAGAGRMCLRHGRPDLHRLPQRVSPLPLPASSAWPISLPAPAPPWPPSPPPPLLLPRAYIPPTSVPGTPASGDPATGRSRGPRWATHRGRRGPVWHSRCTRAEWW